ncbi:MAG: class I SAM-dependent methyltransferase [Gammaproteobacteria bacterium]|jgi:predicted O-methyltransferase YrrM|nr:class I SAM-dependent methyltransferase [Gammaproteobacteria bacterium]
MSRYSKFIEPGIADYVSRHTSAEPALAKDLREQTAAMPQANMQISADQGQLLQLLLRLMGARRCLEIGVFTGYSSMLAAWALPDDGQIVACDISAEWTDIARDYWQRAGVAEKIDLRLQPAAQTLRQLLADGAVASFDFAFIDADKVSYDEYYELCLQLVRPGGLIMFDNVLWSGRVVLDSIQDDDTQALQQLNRKLANDDRVQTLMLAMADGISLVLKH